MSDLKKKNKERIEELEKRVAELELIVNAQREDIKRLKQSPSLGLVQYERDNGLKGESNG